MKILVGYDGSSVAREAVDLAIRHAKAFGAMIHVVTSLVGDTKTTSEECTEAETKLDFIKKLVESNGIEVETHLLVLGRTPAEDICDFARKHKVDEIVIGLQKHSAVGKLLFGSNARTIILNAPCPVVTLR